MSNTLHQCMVLKTGKKYHILDILMIFIFLYLIVYLLIVHSYLRNVET